MTACLSLHLPPGVGIIIGGLAMMGVAGLMALVEERFFK